MGYRDRHPSVVVVRYLQPGLSIQEIIEWIESIPEDNESYQQNIHKFNDAVKDLIAYGEPAVKPLIDHLLLSNSSWMHWGAIWALQDIGDQRAIEPIWTILNRTKDDLGIQIQHHALLALSRFKYERIFEVAVSLLNHEYDYMKHTAITALGNLGDRRAAQVLIPLLEYSDSDIKIVTTSPSGDLEDNLALEPLISEIPQSKVREMNSIIEALGKIGGMQAVDALQKIIDANDMASRQSAHYDRLRCNAVDALAQMNDSSVIPILQAALNHPKQGVRRHARKALLKVSDKP